MKKAYAFWAFLFVSYFAAASTNITTPTVAGHWTTAGSPYYIYNNITVPTGSLLVIDPGVQVIFKGTYELLVMGMMQAQGTAAQHIAFTRTDTTGWSTDTVTAAGGWYGIRFDYYFASVPDSSRFSYCDLSHVKQDSVGYVTTSGVLESYRLLNIDNCNFFNNASYFWPMRLVEIYNALSNTATINITNCNFHDNYAPLSSMITASTGGLVTFSGNHVYNNVAGTTVIMNVKNLLIQNNEFDNNNTWEGAISTFCDAGVHNTGLIKNNKIHHNTSRRKGVITTYNGFIDIIGNSICNNAHVVAGTCGHLYGGGGIFLETDGGVDTAFFNVIDNVIANNYSADFGGGIELFQSNARIVNNTIINNKSSDGSGIYVFASIPLKALVQNNIFNGNYSFNHIIEADIMGIGPATVTYSHNWTRFSFHQLGSIVNGWVVGDSTKIVRGTDPGLVAPTDSIGLSQDGYAANFKLLATSPCVNKGDTTGAMCQPLDCANSTRLVGSAIDIGAYEYKPATNGIEATEQSDDQMVLYPNPVQNTLTITLAAGTGTLQLFNLEGRIIERQFMTSTTTRFDCSELPAGIYLVVWQGENGQHRMEKIVVAH